MFLRKGVYLYDYMDEWATFNKTLLPEKEVFYCNLNIEDIKDANHLNAKRFYKYFGKKNR